MQSIYDTRTWQQLQELARQHRQDGLVLTDLFAADPARTDRHSIEAAGLYLDFSRHHCDGNVWARLLQLPRHCGLDTAIRALFAGEPVNTTEGLPALHMALRGHTPCRQPEVPRQVSMLLSKMEQLCTALHDGSLTGSTDRPINTIVNIGIGGSDLGPALVCDALWPHHRHGLRCHFVSNMDPSHLHRTVQPLDPETTLFIVASKSFRTAETLNNARTARDWLRHNGIEDDATHHHFIATTARPERAVEFGIHERHILPVYDWTGGRFSLWSGIGLPVAMMTGMPAFRSLLNGARRMDTHYRESPADRNMPVIMALLDIWNRLYLGSDSHVILPYSQALAMLPGFLQQLEMESLGKSVTRDGEAVPGPTGLVVWGSQGTNGQHSFHQLLHQGSRPIAADFIAVATGHVPEQQHSHQLLLAHCLAQSRALMEGRSRRQVLEEMLADGMEPREAERLTPHRAVPGNRPSSTLLLPALTPAMLGALIALYEHKVHALSVLWGINAFDQWGVELGKDLSGPMHDALRHGPGESLDPSSRELVRRCRRHQQE